MAIYKQDNPLLYADLITLLYQETGEINGRVDVDGIQEGINPSKSTTKGL